MQTVVLADTVDVESLAGSIRLVEIFSSIQGEGVLVGRRQVFVRTYGCNVRCTYCDSPETLKESGTPTKCRIERPAGSWMFDSTANPVSSKLLTETVRAYLSEPHHSLSITGGEPLLHARFLSRWLPEIRSLGLAVFLETNGLLPEHLKMVIQNLDYVSMDFKPPSAIGMDAGTSSRLHREFLTTASAKQVYGKLVVTPRTTNEELESVVQLIESVNCAIPLILQPVTPCGFEPAAAAPSRLIDLHALASRRLKDVRVIPQTHKIMSLL